MTEFVVVAPVLLLIGLALLQYSLLFVARNQVNHAGFMATRAGSMHNATADSISTAYLRHLAPLYGGGGNAAEIAASVARAAADMGGNYRIELINPTRTSFDDFNDPDLKQSLKTDARVIPNSNLAMRDPSVIGGNSGQNIFDANLLKVRITHGYKPGVPMVGRVFAEALEAAHTASTTKDAFAGRLIAAGRVPITTEITLHMNSPAIEWAEPVWISASGPAGDPRPPTESPRPPDASAPTPAPTPTTGGDGVGPSPGNPDANDAGENPPAGDSAGNNANSQGSGQDSSTGCGSLACPVCPVNPPKSDAVSMSADTLFEFDKAILKPDGLTQLDILIKEVRQAHKEGQAIGAVTVTGHTDPLGSDAANLRLSQARAEAVRDYMKRQGFPDVPITVVGKGAADPVVPLESCKGTTEQKIACLAPNRRVVVDIRRARSEP